MLVDSARQTPSKTMIEPQGVWGDRSELCSGSNDLLLDWTDEYVAILVVEGEKAVKVLLTASLAAELESKRGAGKV